MILLTGATGFVGRNVLERLGAHAVHALARAPGPDLPGVIWHAHDLLRDDPRALITRLRPRACLHLAWFATPGKFWTAPENEDWVAATLRLGRALGDVGARLVAVGTCAEYGWGDGTKRLVPGVTPLDPATPYGRAKHRAHQELKALGIDLAWARLFSLYGRHEQPDRLVASIIRSLLKRDAVELSDGLQRVDFMAAGDVADALVTLLDSPERGAFDVATGSAIAVRDLALAIADRLKGRDLLRFGARPRGTAPDLLEGDPAALARIGWRPRLDLDAGLATAIDWWRVSA